jgi:hypothetical protein
LYKEYIENYKLIVKGSKEGDRQRKGGKGNLIQVKISRIFA